MPHAAPTRMTPSLKVTAAEKAIIAAELPGFLRARSKSRERERKGGGKGKGGKDQEPCRNFARGLCTRGDQCHYSHAVTSGSA